ncbi:MAG: ATPase domain-containing protein [Candidatus Bathyarchaeia archaeon]
MFYSGQVTRPCLLERILHHNLQGELTLVYGESGSGKTAIALDAAISKAREGRTTIFVDADFHVSAERIRQMSGVDLQKILPLVYFVRPNSFRDLTRLLQSLGNYVNPKMGVIIVDTVTSLYRVELTSSNVFRLNRELSLQLAYLADLALTYNLMVILTSQVKSSLAENGVKRFEPVGNRVLRYWSRNIVKILPARHTQVRELLVEKGSEQSVVGRMFCLRLTEEGLVEVF